MILEQRRKEIKKEIDKHPYDYEVDVDELCSFFHYCDQLESEITKLRKIVDEKWGEGAVDNFLDEME